MPDITTLTTVRVANVSYMEGRTTLDLVYDPPVQMGPANTAGISVIAVMNGIKGMVVGDPESQIKEGMVLSEGKFIWQEQCQSQVNENDRTD